MIPARQSTAFEFAIGPVLDADGVAVTDCVVGDFKIKKTTGNFAALNGSATLTHVSAGVYDLVLTASDMDTVGLATIAIDDTVNACPMVRIQVMEEVIYDAIYAASANAFAGSAGSTTLGAGAITATVIATGAIDADAIADNAIDAGAIAADAITAAKIANGAIDAATFAADVDAEILSYLVDDATRIDASALNTATGTTLSTILADTNELQTDWANGGRLDNILDARASQTSVDDVPTNAELATALAGADDATLAAIAALNNLSAAQVNAEVDTALADVGLTTTVTGRIDVAISSRGTGAAMDAAGVRMAVGLASANLDTHLAAIDDFLDTEIAAIKAKTDNLPASPAAVGSAMTLTSGERDSVAAALLDLAAGVETNRTVRQAMRLILAALVGKLSGAAGTTVTIRDTNDAVNRITATVDEHGNRSAVTLDPS